MRRVRLQIASRPCYRRFSAHTAFDRGAALSLTELFIKMPSTTSRLPDCSRWLPDMKYLHPYQAWRALGFHFSSKTMSPTGPIADINRYQLFCRYWVQSGHRTDALNVSL